MQRELYKFVGPRQGIVFPLIKCRDGYAIQCENCESLFQPRGDWSELTKDDCYCVVCRDYDNSDRSIMIDDYNRAEVVGHRKGGYSAFKSRKPLPMEQVFARDRYECFYCGFNPKKFPEVDMILLVDHICRFEDGGDDSMKNLLTCCEECLRISRKIWSRDGLVSAVYNRRKALGLPNNRGDWHKYAESLKNNDQELKSDLNA